MVRESMMASAPRMSISALNQVDDPDRQVRIWLLSSVNVKGTVYYRVAGRFTTSGQTWQVNRRYSEFLMLRDTLVKFFSRAEDTCPGCLNYLHAIKQFDFPKKHVFVSKSQLVVNYRIKALRSFMNLLASWTFSNAPKCPTCGGFAFDIVRNFVLEGADAVGESSMAYIRESFVVSTFTEQGRRSSLTRRNSFIPSSGSQTQNGHRRDQPRPSELQRRNTVDLLPQDQQDSDAYETFNDYLVRPPSTQTKGLQARSSINIPHNRESRQESARSTTAPTQSTNSGGSSAHPDHSASSSRPASQNGSFLFYQDGSERANSASSASLHQPPPSTGSKRGILKNRNEVRAPNDSYVSLGADSATSGNVHANPQTANKRGILKNRNENRSENNSYFSLGGSSDNSRDAEEEMPRPVQQGLSKSQLEARSDVRYDRSQNDSYLSLGGSTSDDLEDEYHSHHPSVLRSPMTANFIQPPSTQKYVGPASSHPSRRTPRSSSQPKSSHRHQQAATDDSLVSDASLRFDGMQHVDGDDSDDSDDDIDVTGVAIQKPLTRRKSASGEGLWEPWELAKAG